MLVLLGDLHLGCGNELEDFLLWGDDLYGPGPHLRVRARLGLDELLVKFLVTKMAHAVGAGLMPTLVLLGDVFDFWQVQRPREPAQRALERILEAHLEVVCGLREWLCAGGRINLIIGAHDQPLVERRTWELLRETFPGINATTGGRPSHYLCDENTGLYAEHGHLWDPHYRFHRLDRPDAACVGREVFRHLVNLFEPMVPCLDKTTSLSGMVRLAQSILKPSHRREAFRLLAGALKASSFLLHVLEPWVDGRAADWHSLEERERRAIEYGLRRALSTRPGGTAGRLPAQPRFFASAHTHRACRRLTRRGIEYLNPGTWKPTVLFEEGRQPRIVQSLPYIQILPDGTGGWEAGLRQWREESGSAP